MVTKKNFLKNTFDKNVKDFQKLWLKMTMLFNFFLRHFVNCNPFYFVCDTFLIKIDIQQRKQI